MKTWMILALAMLTGCASAPGTPAAAAPAFDPVAPPDYDSDRGIRFESSRDEYDAARADSRYAMRQFTYPSDGLTVGAYLYDAAVPAAHRKLPVIVYNRGSYVRPSGFAGEMLVMAHRYAEAGFIVVAPQYRGSNGWAGKDELGGAEVHDVLNVVPALARIPGADTSRIFLAGESRGGAEVYMALREGFPARAAAVWGAFTDLAPLVNPGGPQAQAANYVWPDFVERRDEIILSRSIIYWAHRIHTPVLIMHGGDDQDIPVEQSEKLDAEFTRLGKEHKFIVFEGQQHVIGGKGAERDAAAIAWFRKYDGKR